MTNKDMDNVMLKITDDDKATLTAHGDTVRLTVDMADGRYVIINPDVSCGVLTVTNKTVVGRLRATGADYIFTPKARGLL